MQEYGTLEYGQELRIGSGETVRIYDFTIQVLSSGRFHTASATVTRNLEVDIPGELVAFERFYSSTQCERHALGASQMVRERFFVKSFCVQVRSSGRSHCVRVKVNPA